MSEPDGSIDTRGAGGIYVRDRRLIEGLRLTVDGHRPRLLGRARTGPGSDRLVYGHWGNGPDPTAIILRDRSIGAGIEDRLELRAFRSPSRFDLRIELDPGGGLVYDLGDTSHRAAAADEVRRTLWTDGFGADASFALSADVDLEPGRSCTMRWGLELGQLQPRTTVMTTISTSDGVLDRAVRNARWDLEALTVVDPGSGASFLAAGSPHFLAVFGRDALVASSLAMLASPERALDTLRVLADSQGSVDDPRTVEEPGRILHELRIGDMGVFGLPAGAPYYGSVDATPLFVALLAECLAWGGPRDQLAELLPAARRAVAWCRRHVDRLGFVHSLPHDQGIGNQGWKDSGDSMVRPDGSVLDEATSLVEVQGYVHAALVGLGQLEEYVADDPAAANRLRLEADDFARRFHRSFAVESPAVFGMALDADGVALDVRGSNVGHLLSTGIIDDESAKRIARRLVDPVEHSGWGLRTLAATETAYNPLGYHLGSVWPHDTAALLRGLSHRGFDGEAQLVANALLDLLDELDGELPELLGGFARSDVPAPVAYPASARPQAWAAAVPIQIVASMLGIRPRLHEGRLLLRPRVGPNREIVVDGLRLGDRSVRIVASDRTAVVSGDLDGLEVVVEP